MANEAVWNDEQGRALNFTIADAPAVTKGALMKLSGSRTVGASAAGDVWAGILARDKVASDGITSAAIYTNGVFTLYAGGGTTIAIGENVKLSGANIVEGDVAEADWLAGKVIGKNLGPAIAVGTAGSIQVLVGTQ